MTAEAISQDNVTALLAAQQLLYTEARLLDERRFDEWLDLFTDDALYHLPIALSDDPREPALIRDTKSGMAERVFRLTKTLAHAQNPPSRTQHDVTNIELLAPLDRQTVQVHCNQAVHEMRSGDVFHVGLASPRIFAARCRYLLVPGPQWRIQEKTCQLIDREYPIYNLTFIL